MEKKSPHQAIRFSSLPWEQGGHPFERKKTHPDHPVALLEFAPGFIDPNWCRNGHTGYVLSGSLLMDYGNESDLLHEGDAFWIEPGTPHQASNPAPGPVRLLIVTWPAPPGPFSPD